MIDHDLHGHNVITGVTSAAGGTIVFNFNASAPAQPHPRPCHTIPFRKDPDFIERGDLLDRVDQLCSQPAGRAALVGLGGVGKSQLAIEYAHRTRGRSPDTWVFWVPASNSARFRQAYKELADRLELPGRERVGVSVLQLVRQWLSTESNGQWLMVVDNIDDEALLEPSEDSRGRLIVLAEFIPQTNNGAVLFTSRHRDVARQLVGRDKDIIAVDTMHPHEALKLLKGSLTTTLDETAEDLVTALDCIPLAVAQAAAYINKFFPRMSCNEYLQKLNIEATKVELLGTKMVNVRRDMEQASQPVLATWDNSFAYVRSTQPTAADLLSFLSFSYCQGIPESLAKRYRDTRLTRTSREAPYNDQQDQFEEDLALLRDLSFISNRTSKHSFEMHGLVQLSMRTWLYSEGAGDMWRDKFIAILSDEFPANTRAHQKICGMLLPGKVHPDTLLIVFNIAMQLQALSRYDEARELYQQAALGFASVLGPHHQHSIDCKRQYAELLSIMNHLSPSTPSLESEYHDSTSPRRLFTRVVPFRCSKPSEDLASHGSASSRQLEVMADQDCHRSADRGSTNHGSNATKWTKDSRSIRKLKLLLGMPSRKSIG